MSETLKDRGGKSGEDSGVVIIIILIGYCYVSQAECGLEILFLSLQDDGSVGVCQHASHFLRLMTLEWGVMATNFISVLAYFQTFNSQNEKDSSDRLWRSSIRWKNGGGACPCKAIVDTQEQYNAPQNKTSIGRNGNKVWFLMCARLGVRNRVSTAVKCFHLWEHPAHS